MRRKISASFSICEVKSSGAHTPHRRNDAPLIIERIVAVELVKILSFFTSSHRPRTDDQYIIARHWRFLSSSDTASPPLTQAMLVSYPDLTACTAQPQSALA